ncbi:transcription factor PCF3-like [Hordeum vulgare]|nr:transcription factor PCF3-like [Hordeum vulgare]
MWGDFGQMWSFAPPPEMMVVALVMAGEASAARVGNYLPMAQANLNLLVAVDGGEGRGRGGIWFRDR